jgi:poly-gamma-glutamate synthase PgsB/CapB
MRFFESQVTFFDFEPNPRLALAVAQSLGVPRERALESLGKLAPDEGGLGVWQMPRETAGTPWIFANAFAANEPESTRKILQKITQLPRLDKSHTLAVLNLRADRPDRTWQWIEAIKSSQFAGIDRYLVTGRHAALFKRKTQNRQEALDVQVLKKNSVNEVLAALSSADSGSLVVGMGNLGGLGEALVRYCQDKGTPYAV